MDNRDIGKETVRIYIFGYKFVITSDSEDGVHWNITVSLGKLKEEYQDYVANRYAAEQAALGYFLIEHCQGGIYWQEPSEEDKKKLLAEKINPEGEI